MGGLLPERQQKGVSEVVKGPRAWQNLAIKRVARQVGRIEDCRAIDRQESGLDPYDVLQERRLARLEQSEREGQILQMHERAIRALFSPIGESVRSDALVTIRAWEERGLCNPEHIAAWRLILTSRDRAVIEDLVLREDEDGVALRQNTPFSPEALSFVDE